jgi:hypothetical protein
LLVEGSKLVIDLLLVALEAVVALDGSGDAAA